MDLRSEERTYKSSVSYGENEVKERLQAGLQGRRGLLDLGQSDKQTHSTGH